MEKRSCNWGCIGRTIENLWRILLLFIYFLQRNLLVHINQQVQDGFSFKHADEEFKLHHQDWDSPEMLAISSVTGFILKLHKSAACSSRLTLSSLPVNIVSIPKPATVAQRKRYTDCPGLNQNPIPEVQPINNTWIAQEGDSTWKMGVWAIRGRLKWHVLGNGNSRRQLIPVLCWCP